MRLLSSKSSCRQIDDLAAVAAVAVIAIIALGSTTAISSSSPPPSSCRVLTLLPLSDSKATSINQSEENGYEDGLSLLRSAVLAAKHFNSRNSAVVPELAAAEFALPSAITSSTTPKGSGNRFMRGRRRGLQTASGYGGVRGSGLATVAAATQASYTSSRVFEHRSDKGRQGEYQGSTTENVTIDLAASNGGGGIGSGCDVWLSVSMADSSDGAVSNREVLSTLMHAAMDGEMNEFHDVKGMDDTIQTSQLCAVLLGPSAADVSPVASALGLTQIMYAGRGKATSSSSNAKNIHGQLNALPVSLDAPITVYGSVSASFLSRPKLDRQYVTLLFDGTASTSVELKLSLLGASSGDGTEGGRSLRVKTVVYFPSQSVQAALKASAARASNNTSERVGGNDRKNDGGDKRSRVGVSNDNETFECIRNAISDVTKIGYKTVIFAPGDVSILPLFAAEADAAGLLDGTWMWVVPETSGAFSKFVKETRAVPGESLDRFLRGAALIRAIDGFDKAKEREAGSHGNGAADGAKKFLDAWEAEVQENATTLGSTKSVALDKSTKKPGLPSIYASFVYDSVMAVGMGACRRAAVAQGGKGGGNEIGAEEAQSLAGAIRTLTFRGASGTVSFDASSGERASRGVTFGVYNVRAIIEDDIFGGEKASYRQVLTSFMNSNDEIWCDVAGESFIYASGSEHPPQPVRYEQPSSFISRHVHCVGMILMALSLVVSVGSGILVYAKRDSCIIRASQPQFLYILCFGSALSASSIGFISFDESYGWSAEKLSRSCIASAWFFVLGYIIVHAALHMKLLRIHRVLQFRKNVRVPLHQVALPFAVLLFSAVIVLAIWTVVDPFEWKRVMFNDIPSITCGMCMSERFWTFLTPLALIILTSNALTTIIAWKARDIPCEYQETTWIFFGVFAHLQSWIIGIPVLIVLSPANTTPDASYLGKVMLIFTFSISMIMLIIWPKMYTLLKKEVFGYESEISGFRSSLVIGVGNFVRVTGLGQPGSGSQHEHSRISKRCLKLQVDSPTPRSSANSSNLPNISEINVTQMSLPWTDQEPSCSLTSKKQSLGLEDEDAKQRSNSFSEHSNAVMKAARVRIAHLEQEIHKKDQALQYTTDQLVLLEDRLSRYNKERESDM